MKQPLWGDTVLAMMIGLGTAAMVAFPWWLLIGMWQPRRDEVLRLANATGGEQAVVVEWGGGVTSRLHHEVHVVATGRPTDGSSLVATFDDAELDDLVQGVACRWSSPTTLVVEYQRARRAEGVTPPPGVPARRIVVELAAGRTFAGRPGTTMRERAAPDRR